MKKKDENKDEEKAKSVDKNSAAVSNLRLLENIEVKLTVEVGNTEVKIKDLLRLFVSTTTITIFLIEIDSKNHKFILTFKRYRSLFI